VNGGSDYLYVVRDPNATLSGVGTKVEAQGSCSAGMLIGAFGYAGDGSITAADGRAVSIAEIGIITFDGAGNLSGIYSAVADGKSERREYSGVYSVAENCTANAQFKIRDANYNVNFVVANGGGCLSYSEVGPDSVIAGLMTRTFPR
jgi:hypothetical protein